MKIYVAYSFKAETCHRMKTETYDMKVGASAFAFKRRADLMAGEAKDREGNAIEGVIYAFYNVDRSIAEAKVVSETKRIIDEQKEATKNG